MFLVNLSLVLVIVGPDSFADGVPFYPFLIFIRCSLVCFFGRAHILQLLQRRRTSPFRRRGERACPTPRKEEQKGSRALGRRHLSNRIVLSPLKWIVFAYWRQRP
nr:hypothetical protein [Pandoravirus massiliensis]